MSKKLLINSAFWVIFQGLFCQNQLFQKIISEITSECQTVWIQIRPDILWLFAKPERLSADDTSRQWVVCILTSTIIWWTLKFICVCSSIVNTVSASWEGLTSHGTAQRNLFCEIVRSWWVCGCVCKDPNTILRAINSCNEEKTIHMNM